MVVGDDLGPAWWGGGGGRDGVTGATTSAQRACAGGRANKKGRKETHRSDASPAGENTQERSEATHTRSSTSTIGTSTVHVLRSARWQALSSKRPFKSPRKSPVVLILN